MTSTTPPTVTATTPTAGTNRASRTANVIATFSEAVKAVNGTTFSLRGTATTGARLGAAVTYNATTRVATLNPNANLLAHTRYTGTLTGGTAGHPGHGEQSAGHPELDLHHWPVAAGAPQRPLREIRGP